MDKRQPDFHYTNQLFCQTATGSEGTMPKESDGSMERFWRAEELMQQGRIDEARPLIEALEKDSKLPPDVQLTWQLLKSQLLITTGDFETSHQLANKVWKESQERGKPLQAVDACIVMAEAQENLSKYEESLETITQGEQVLKTLAAEAPAALTRRKASLIYLRGRICFCKSNYDQALEHFEQSLALRQKLGNKHDIAVSLQNVGLIHFFKGDVDQALEYAQQVLRLFQEAGNNYRLAWCLTNFGVLYRTKGELDQALEYSQQGLALFQEVGNKQSIAWCFGCIGDIYERKGELNQALKYYEQNMMLFEELGQRSFIGGSPLDSIARIYWHKGEVDLALAYYQKGLALWQEIDNKFWIALSHSNIGLVYWQKGALDQALEMLEQSLTLGEEAGAKLATPWTLFWLISVTLDKGALEQAQEYLQRLQQINEQVKNKTSSQRIRLAEALVLKASPRIRDKGQAQVIFQEIAEAEIIDHPLTVVAMVNLCELLLDELKTYGEADVLHETKTLVHRLYALAQDQHSFPLVVKVLILQAKLALVEGKLPTAAKLLEQAKLTAEEKKLGLLAERAAAEKQHMEDQYDMWRRLIQTNAPFGERLEHARVTDYLKDVEKLVSQQRLEASS